jgi:putative holliday junction resolvase
MLGMVKESTTTNKTILAFDFGTSKIGVAVGQTITGTANPLAMLKARHGVPQWSEVSQLINNWKPNVLIVGVPYNMDGSEQAMTHAAREFVRQLQAKFSLPVEEVDERLTTVEAKQILFELGGYKALQKVSIDSFAAKLILESWIQKRLKQ